MGYCKDCAYSISGYRETLFGGAKPALECSLMGKIVDSFGSCNKFSEKYNESNMGYRGGGKSSGGCFLTSACVEYLGKEDNCEELTALRNFRDGYMNKTEEGKELIKEYYQVAPQIVQCIDSSSQKDDFYKYIYGEICKCVNLIQGGENETVLNIYKNMVLHLKSECKI